ncbi:hypothetical protein G6F40_013454 [Rhizopus arrhizus]|nr:hypothetical protein G6F40_013454 [Rhizopus arrhizus]
MSTDDRRLHGLDLARYLALAGMVLVNFRLAMAVPAEGNGGLAGFFHLLEGKASATFVTLAGLGLVLATQRQGWWSASVQTWRRALRYPALLRGVLRTVGAVAACVATAVAGQHRRPGRRFVLGAAAVGLQRRLELADAGVCRPVAVARHGAQPVVQRLPSVAALAVLLPAGHAAGTPAVVAASGAARTAGAGPAADLGRAWRAATGAGNTLAAERPAVSSPPACGWRVYARASGWHRSLRPGECP